MAHTDRDQDKYTRKHHHKFCTRWSYFIDGSGYRRYRYGGWCICEEWFDYRWYSYPPPSWWNREIRKQERAFTRNKMQRARAGSRDWSSVDEKRGDECYW